MSASLVRKGLELFKEDLVEERGPKKKRASKSALRLPTTKTGLKKLKQAGKNPKPAAELTVKGKKVKSSLKKHQQHKAADNTEEAIKYLQFLSSKKTNSKVTEEFVEYQQRRAVQPASSQQQTKQPKSCFSEEDFARFEREHFVGTRKRPATERGR